MQAQFRIGRQQCLRRLKLAALSKECAQIEPCLPAAGVATVFRRGRSEGRVRHLNQLAVGLGLDEAVHIPIADVIPHPLRIELEGIHVAALPPMIHAVPLTIPPAPHVTTDQADPEVLQVAFPALACSKNESLDSDSRASAVVHGKSE